jgi:DHA2 family multidrug resistance protein
MSAPGAPQTGPPVHKWLITIAVMLGATMEVVDTSIANVALPHMQGTLSASVDEITWVITSYLVANAIIIPLGGWFSDIFGRKNFFNTCVVIFTGASVACGASQNLETLVFFRIVQGAAGGALIPLSQAIMLETFPPKEQGMAMALWGVGIMFAPIIGPYLGGWITDNYSWRWIFYVNVPVGALTFFLVGLFVHDPPYLRARRGQQASDWWGLGFLILGVGCLQMTLDLGERRDWFDSELIRWLTFLSLTGLVAFVIRENLTRDPLINMGLFRSRSYSMGVFLMGVVGFVLYGGVILVPIHAQGLLGYSALDSGKVLAPMGIATLFTMPLAGALVNRYDARFLLAIGSVTLAWSMFLAADLNLDVSFWHMTFPRIIMGLSLGFIFVPLTMACMSRIPQQQMNAASGFFNLSRNIGGSIGIALMATLLARRGQHHQTGLVENITPYAQRGQEAINEAARLLASRGMDPALAGDGAVGMLYGEIQRQATMNAFIDNYWLLGWITVIAIPLIYVMRKPDPTAATHVH